MILLGWLLARCRGARIRVLFAGCKLVLVCPQTFARKAFPRTSLIGCLWLLFSSRMIVLIPLSRKRNSINYCNNVHHRFSTDHKNRLKMDKSIAFERLKVIEIVIDSFDQILRVINP